MKEFNLGYQSFINSTLDAVIIIDNEGKVIEWNSNAQTIFLWTKEEALKNYIYNLIIPERFIEAHKDGMQTFFETGEGPILNKRIEIVGLDKKKREFPIELAISPLNVNGNMFFSAFIRDISARNKIRNTLNEERNLFSQIIESITEPIFYKSTSHEYLNCNQAFADLHSKIIQEIIGKTDDELYGKKEAIKFKESDLFVINQKKPAIMEEWFSYKDGRTKYFNTIKLPSVNEKGEVLGIVGICKDLTEIKKVESKHRHLNIEMQKVIKSLKENEKYLEGINRFASTILKQNTIDEIIWEVTDNLIKELGVVDCVIYLLDDQKKNLIQRAAYGPKQLSEQEIKNPIVIPLGKGIVGSVAKTGKSELITDTSLDSRYIIDDEVRLSEITVPIIADGSVIGVIDSEHPKKNYFSQAHLDKLQTVANLVSSRMKGAINQEKLLIAQKSINKLSTAVEQSTLPILITDNNGIIEFVNTAFEKLTAYSSQESIGRKTSFLKSGEQSDSYYNQLWETILKGDKWTGELVNINKYGQKYWVLASISPIMDEEGIVSNFVYFQTDITKMKRLENELISAKSKAEAADKSKSQFLANMSHEIRTPLNGVIGMIREFGRDKLSPKQQYNLESAMKASQHLLSLVNNIMDISKIEAGEFGLNPIHFNIHSLLNDVYSILSPQAETKSIGLNINIDKNIPEIFIGDESTIRQILINIAGNAIKFTAKGEVTIHCFCINKPSGIESESSFISYNDNCNPINNQNDSLRINFMIQDTGIGMDEAFLDTLFDKFQQEDLSINRKFGGTGLGLFITKQLVDLMNGSIKVKSVKGKGTEMHICLPLPVGDFLKVENNEIIVDNKQLIHARILLVEDNEMNRVVACNTLKQFNVEITEAENGVQAIEILKKESFDIILMDIQMPLMNGIEATRIIRNQLKIQTPIIALSADALKSEVEACLAIGMNEYITKPFEDQELFRVIAKHYRKPVDLRQNKQPEDNLQTEVSDLLYDLSKLKKMSMGNDAFINKMLTLFVDNYPVYIKEMKTHFEKGDLEKLKNLAHKIKPSINDLGIKSIQQDILDIEKFKLEEDSIVSLKSKTEHVIVVLKSVLEQIKKEIL